MLRRLELLNLAVAAADLKLLRLHVEVLPKELEGVLNLANDCKTLVLLLFLHVLLLFLIASQESVHTLEVSFDQFELRDKLIIDCYSVTDNQNKCINYLLVLSRDLRPYVASKLALYGRRSFMHLRRRTSCLRPTLSNPRIIAFTSISLALGSLPKDLYTS